MSPASNMHSAEAQYSSAAPSMLEDRGTYGMAAVQDGMLPALTIPHGPCLQRKRLMPLAQRKGCFDSAEWAMALQKGDLVLEPLPSPLEYIPKRTTMERQPSRLRRSSYWHGGEFIASGCLSPSSSCSCPSPTSSEGCVTSEGCSEACISP